MANDDSISEGHPPRAIDLDAAIEKFGGEEAARWRRTPRNLERRTLSKAEQRLQAIRHGELAGQELQAEVVAALTKTEQLLFETPIDDVLKSHGWSERMAQSLAAHLAVIRAMVEDGRYRANSSYSELSLLDGIDPKSRDALQDAVYELQSLLRVASLRSHPE